MMLPLDIEKILLKDYSNNSFNLYLESIMLIALVQGILKKQLALKILREFLTHRKFLIF